MRKNLSELLNMRLFETMEDIKKFEKYSLEDLKKINSLKGEIAKPKDSCPTKRNQGTQKTFENASRRSDGERSSKKRASDARKTG